MLVECRKVDIHALTLVIIVLLALPSGKLGAEELLGFYFWRRDRTVACRGHRFGGIW